MNHRELRKQSYKLAAMATSLKSIGDFVAMTETQRTVSTRMVAEQLAPVSALLLDLAHHIRKLQDVLDDERAEPAPEESNSTRQILLDLVRLITATGEREQCDADDLAVLHDLQCRLGEPG